MRRFATLTILMLLATGCDNNVETGTTADPDPTATATPPVGDDDDDTTTPWDPGTLPAQIGGMATFALSRNRAVGDLAGAFDDFGGMVNFFPVPVPLPPTMQDVWDDFPEHPIDVCLQVYPSSVTLATNIDPPGAGDITLEGPNGNMSLTMMLGIGMYISFWNSPALYQPMSDYVLRATGGQIPAFQVPMKSPGLITTLTPDITSAAPFVVSRNAPLELKWESVPDGRPIYLSFTQQDSPEQYVTIWMCKLTDDGAFDVPVEVLQNFGATVPPFATEDWRDKMELRRWHYGSFTVPGAVAPVLSAFESGWWADIQFE